MKILTRKAVLRWARLLVWGVAAYGVAMFFADRWWGLELVSNLRMFAAFGALLGAALSLAMLAPLRTVTGVLVAVWMAWPVLDYYGLGSVDALTGSGREDAALDAVDGEKDVPSFTLVSFNVGPENSPMAGLVETLTSTPKSELPDCVFLMEVRPGTYREHYNAMRRIFPHHVADPRSDNFGVWLMSRWPITEDRTRSKRIRKLVDDLPLVDVDIKHKKLGPLRVLGVHPVPPMTRDTAAFRAKYFNAMKTITDDRDADVPLVVAGDFNCAPWSHWFDDLCSGMSVRNAAYGHGFLLTWKPWMGVPMVGLPLDHVLVSDHWVVESFAVGDADGSDHRPLEVKLTARDAE